MIDTKMYGFSLENDSLGWGFVRARTIGDALDKTAGKALTGNFDLPCLVNAKVVSLDDDEEQEFFFVLATDPKDGETYYVIDPGPSTCRELGLPGY